MRHSPDLDQKLEDARRPTAWEDIRAHFLAVASEMLEHPEVTFCHEAKGDGSHRLLIETPPTDG